MIYKGDDLKKLKERSRIYYEEQLQQINFLDTRVYKTPTGEYFPSVTTVLQYMPKAKYFENWLKDVGHSAEIIVQKASEEGTAVHNAIERLIAGEEVHWLDEYGRAKYSLSTWNMILRAQEFFTRLKDYKVEHSEILVCSYTGKFAGTVDLVCIIDGKRWLIDIKTSNALSKSYDLQLAAYSKAFEEQEGKKIDRTGILWLKSTKRTDSKKEGTYSGRGWELKPIDKIEENYKLFETVYTLYKLDNPEIEPLFNKIPTVVSLKK